MNKFSNVVTTDGQETLILIPCCAKKTSGGSQVPASDQLSKTVSPVVYANMKSSRMDLFNQLSSSARYTSSKYLKNRQLAPGHDFDQPDTSGKYLPAIERYIGNLYTAHQDVTSAIQKNSNTNNKPHLLILSALYGPLHPLSPIQDYNLQMSDSPAKRIWIKAFPQFLQSYVEAQRIKIVRLYFGTSTAYFDVGRAAVEPLLRNGQLDRASQYNIVDGSSYHTPLNHGLLLLSNLLQETGQPFTRQIEEEEL